MPLVQQSFDQIVSNLVAGWAASLNIQPNLSSGDPLLAIMQDVAIQLMMIQGEIAAVNAFARASTCVGADLDSWMAQFGLIRLPGVAATGTVTFSAPVAVSTAINILPGTIVQTTGGAIQYQVIADVTQPAWNVAQGAYVMAVNTSTVNATVQALVTGTSYNVTQAGLLNQLGTSVGGITGVTNPSAIINSVNPESNAAFLSRFQSYLAGLSKATRAAVLNAASSVQAGLLLGLNENINVSGSTLLGNFVTVVDDGSGSPSSTLVTAVETAQDAVRAFTVQQQAIAVSPVTATIVTNIRVAAGAVAATVQGNVQDAIVDYVNSLPINGTLWLTDVIAVAKDADPNVVALEVASTTINSSQLDLTAAWNQRIVTSSSSVAVGTF